MNNTTLIAGTSALFGAVATYLFLNRKPLQSSPPHTVTVTYWNGRGLAESVRLTLAAAGIPFTHVVPGFEKATHLDQPEHLHHLRTQTDYLIAGQVPLLRINGTSYVQSMATVRMLARRFGLSGATPTETTTVDVIAECIKDWRNSIGGSWEFGMGTTYTTLRLYLFVVICRPHCFLFLCVTGTGNTTLTISYSCFVQVVLNQPKTCASKSKKETSSICPSWNEF